jgi:hypothetical protein
MAHDNSSLVVSCSFFFSMIELVQVKALQHTTEPWLSCGGISPVILKHLTADINLNFILRFQFVPHSKSVSVIENNHHWGPGSIPCQSVCDMWWTVVLERVYLRLFRFFLVTIIPLIPQINLHAVFTRRTNGRSLGTFRKSGCMG